jgi:hypothetical protein
MTLQSSAITPLFTAAFVNATQQITAGYYAPGSLPDFLASSSTSPNSYLRKIVAMGSANGGRSRGANIHLYGGPTTIEDDTIAATVSLLRVCAPTRVSSKPTGFLVEQLGTLALTAASGTVAADTGLGGEELREIDTIGWTPSALCTHYASAYGSSPAAYSPGSDAPGVFTIPDAFGAFGIIIEPTGTKTLNCGYELIT